DLKPSNIFLTRDMKPKVLDFGVALAQYSDTPLNASRQLIGTPNYMSPEQALGRPLDARSDVFSMGAILYELLTGQRAFDGSQVEETLTKVASQPTTPIYQLNPEVPPELIEIVNRAMAKDASERYQSAAEMRNDLVLVAARKRQARPRPRPGRFSFRSPRHPSRRSWCRKRCARRSRWRHPRRPPRGRRLMPRWRWESPPGARSSWTAVRMACRRR